MALRTFQTTRRSSNKSFDTHPSGGEQIKLLSVTDFTVEKSLRVVCHKSFVRDHAKHLARSIRMS